MIKYLLVKDVCWHVIYSTYDKDEFDEHTKGMKFEKIEEINPHWICYYI
jgi:hypothetical protein